MTAKDTLETLVDKHFPGQTQERQPEPRAAGNWARIDPTIITKQKIEWAISTFKPYKSPGKDDMIPAELKAVGHLITPRLEGLYRACLSLGFTPRLWRDWKDCLTYTSLTN